MDTNRTNMVKMGKHISELRKKKGFTQKNLGDILDVSDKTVSKWEKGVVAPDITILSSLAKTLGVSIDEILAGEEDISESNTIEALDIYSTLTKRRLLKYFIALILFLSLVVLFIFRIENYYSWHVTKLFAKKDIALDGYLICNNKESKIIIDHFELVKNYNNKEIKELNIVVKSKDKEIYNENNIFDVPIDIRKALKNQIISIELNKKIDEEDIEVYVIFIDNNDDITSYSIKFK